jgi:hypothetical protein
MEAIDVSNSIEEKISQLEKGTARSGILDKAKDEKAQTIAEYDKCLAIKILEIRSGKEMMFEGLQVKKDLPANLVEKIAKGICWQERLAMEAADANYKNTVTRIGAVEAMLNGYQSIFRHLSHTVQQ